MSISLPEFHHISIYFQANKKDSAYALALANRSAVQMRLGKEGFLHALADIERALKAGHPTPVKLLERKITCCLELAMFPEVQLCSIITHTFWFLL